MPDVYSALESLAAARRNDPLAPVTFVVPSHAAGLQLRRRLAEFAPFAGVRFEALPRIAELLAAGHLASAGRAPLARPIGDYLAEKVALESSGSLERVGELPGYARALRRIFRRLRRGGIRKSLDVRGGTYGDQFAEVIRLYDRFREESAPFYDDEDLLDEAAAVVRAGRAGVLADLGEVLVVPSGIETAGASNLLTALEERAAAYTLLDDPASTPEARFVLAPDPASEAREVVGEVIASLEAGVAVHEIAVFHGADPAYRRLLREAFDAAEIPAVPLPGMPLIETRAGRGVLQLARLPGLDYTRTAVMDLLAIAPLRSWLPASDGRVAALPSAWDRVSREAGITKGADRWRHALMALDRDLDSSIAYHQSAGNEARARSQTYMKEQARDLRHVIETLMARLEPLSEPLPAADLIGRFRRIVEDYFDPENDVLPEVLAEIEQLGTVGAVGGSFTLAAFAEALRANLEVATMRLRSLGSGIAVADYRQAAGLRFQRVVLCGAYEGSLPAGPGMDALVDDTVWALLKADHPHIEDSSARIKSSWAAAERAVRAAGNGLVVWTAPLREPGGTREFYPSPMMRDAAAGRDPAIKTASQLRRHGSAHGWFRRGPSPLSVTLTGPVVRPEDARYRWAIRQRRAGDLAQEHRLSPAITMLRARRSMQLTEWDGNVSGLMEQSWLELQKSVSPTSLESYAVCGFRYFAKSVLGLYSLEEPEERDMMDAADRGSLIHEILNRFFAQQQERGRPHVGEAWTVDDEAMLMRLADEALAAAEERGLMGLSVYSAHEARTIKADLRRFLEEDTLFRQRTGAMPAQFEISIPEKEIAGVTLKGVVDRVDITPDGRSAWVIDYKTGRISDFEEISEVDPLAGGKKLQLPVYMAAAPEASEVRALYWFITQKGGFTTVEYAPSLERRGAFEETLGAILTGIKAGSFPAVPGEDNEYFGRFDNCRYCDYDRVCSRRRDIELATKQEDRAVRPWRLVRLAATGKESQ